jgi:hypothetical protein
MTAMCVLWVRARPDYEPLYLDGLRPDTEWRYWVSEQGTEVNTCSMGEDMGYTVTEVKIALPMSHNTLTSVDEYVK